jgi:Tfp pilus assembly protein PilX
VTGTRTTETVPSSVASTDSPAVGTLQAQVTETAPIVATSSSVPAHALQTQTTSQPRASIEDQPDSLESEEDTSQFVITPRSSAPDTTASVPPSDP